VKTERGLFLHHFHYWMYPTWKKPTAVPWLSHLNECLLDQQKGDMMLAVIFPLAKKLASSFHLHSISTLKENPSVLCNFSSFTSHFTKNLYSNISTLRLLIYGFQSEVHISNCKYVQYKVRYKPPQKTKPRRKISTFCFITNKYSLFY